MSVGRSVGSTLLDDLKRRRKLLAEKTSGALIVIAGYDVMQLSGDQAAPFVQDANFLWLTGVKQAGWKAIFDGSRQHLTLVAPELTAIQEIFDGGIDEAAMREATGAQAVISSKELEKTLRQLARHHAMVSTPQDKQVHDFVANPAPRELQATLKRCFASVQDCQRQFLELRAIKSPYEIGAIRQSIDLTTEAFSRVRELIANCRYEYEIEAEFSYFFSKNNAKHAYDPIVAAGKNGCILHYGDNAEKATKQDMIVIDIGAKLGDYSADITRTYSVKPCKRQRQVHAAVQKAHQAIIALLQPDLPLAEYIAQVDEIMKDALAELGLLVDRSDAETYRKYFPHAISHGLGLDTHDTLGGFRYLRPGMVLTVEPGIYIPEEGIAVRIEDDILITETGHENLSRSLSTEL